MHPQMFLFLVDNQHKLHIQVASKVQYHCNVTGSRQVPSIFSFSVPNFYGGSCMSALASSHLRIQLLFNSVQAIRELQ
jgi:hypothetical protein